MIANGDTLISRLRVVTSDRDELALRLRMTSALSDLRLPPTALPPAAILFVRRFRDPKPALLDLRFTTSARSNLWRDAVVERLGTFANAAARPASGSGFENAESILFADKAEMMACLAQDWCAGLLTGRWWWRALLRNENSFWTTWIQNPEYVPAAMEHLARAGKVTDFAASLTEEQARMMTQRVIVTFALHHLASVHEVFRTSSVNGTESADQPLTDEQPFEQPRIARSNHHLKPPWSIWVPTARAVSLNQPQALFVGITLMISRAPSVARTQSFALSVERWQRQEFEVGVMRAGPIREEHRELKMREAVPETLVRGARSVRTGLQTPIAQTARELEPRFNSKREASTELLGDTIPNFAGDDTSDTTLLQAEPTNIDPDRSLACPSDHLDPIAAQSAEGASIEDIVQIQPPIYLNEELHQPTDVVIADERTETAPIERAVPEMFEGIEIETEFGGLFYLINLALYLDLYGDFTRPADFGIELNIWDFVALAGDDLIGGDSDDDPVWELLATLAGHERATEIGDALQPLDDWQPPIEWMPAVTVESDGTRPRDRSRIKTPAPVQSWLSRLMVYARARLRAALGVDMNEDLGSLVCRHRGILRVTPTHVDAFFNLGEHPIELRIAGLDRDPGWVPAAGRFISFHYN